MLGTAAQRTAATSDREDSDPRRLALRGRARALGLKTRRFLVGALRERAERGVLNIRRTFCWRWIQIRGQDRAMEEDSSHTNGRSLAAPSARSPNQELAVDDPRPLIRRAVLYALHRLRLRLRRRPLIALTAPRSASHLPRPPRSRSGLRPLVPFRPLLGSKTRAVRCGPLAGIERRGVALAEPKAERVCLFK